MMGNITAGTLAFPRGKRDYSKSISFLQVARADISARVGDASYTRFYFAFESVQTNGGAVLTHLATPPFHGGNTQCPISFSMG